MLIHEKIKNDLLLVWIFVRVITNFLMKFVMLVSIGWRFCFANINLTLVS